MGRPKNFSREEVLEKAIPVFWKKGFSDTCLQDLEKATGVNKSGLYSEFKDKDDLYVQSLLHYIAKNGADEVLMKEPLGFHNIEAFLKRGLMCSERQGGCFSISTVREMAILPPEASEIVNKTFTGLKKMMLSNITAEKPEMDTVTLADMVMTFYAGICVEQNLKNPKGLSNRKIENFMNVLKKL